MLTHRYGAQNYAHLLAECKKYWEHMSNFKKAFKILQKEFTVVCCPSMHMASQYIGDILDIPHKILLLLVNYLSMNCMKRAYCLPSKLPNKDKIDRTGLFVCRSSGPC